MGNIAKRYCSQWSLEILQVTNTICLMLVAQHCLQQRHLVAVEGVDEPSLQQVQDLDRAVAGAADQEVVGRVDGEAVDGGAVNCTTHTRGKKKRIAATG